jgi:fructoselysine-6-P-deglycase FrlB-like protein
MGAAIRQAPLPADRLFIQNQGVASTAEERCHLRSITATGSSHDSAHPAAPALTTSTEMGTRSTNSQGVGLKKSNLKPKGAY